MLTATPCDADRSRSSTSVATPVLPMHPSWSSTAATPSRTCAEAVSDIAPAAGISNWWPVRSSSGIRATSSCCSHQHHDCGDECLSFKLAPELVESLGDERDVWRAGGVPPLPQLMVLGELAQAAADGTSEVGLDEAGLWLVARFVDLATSRRPKPLQARAADRRRAVEAALWLDACCAPSHRSRVHGEDRRA